jgi:hypothetical protein
MNLALYKYMRKQHLEAFLQRGSLKIGTLHEYRRVEDYGKVIGDDEEGIRFTTFNIPGGGTVDLMGNAPEALYLRSSLPIPSGVPLPTLTFDAGAEFLIREAVPDVFIYCTTSKFDLKVMEEFGYDACLEIVRPDAFFRAISRKIRHKGTFLGNAPVHYRNRVTHYTRPHSTPAYMMKGAEYTYQKEVRAVWAPAKTNVAPIYVDVAEAVRYCQTYRIPRT